MAGFAISKHLFNREHGLSSMKFEILKEKRGRRRRCRTLKKYFEQLLEDKAATKGVIEKECDIKGHPKSTFIIAFNHDGRYMATLHGDHSIRIVDVSSGKNIQTLIGHPRSPWTCEFHKSHANILATSCLSGQVRIWDLSSGDCDTWQSPRQSVPSISLHPTAKILLIAESHNVYLWNWETSSAPQLYAASKRACEKVRWVRFDNTGDMFYTGITASAEYDSWNILRQAPSIFDMNQHRMRNEASSRARNHYQSSLSVNISLGEMLGNPLEISNDLLAQPGADANSSVDVYHAATTYAQLHRIHTGENEGNDPLEEANLSASNFRNSGRTPRQPTQRETVEGRFNVNESWSPTSQRRRLAVSSQRRSLMQQLSAPPSTNLPSAASLEIQRRSSAAPSTSGVGVASSDNASGNGISDQSHIAQHLMGSAASVGESSNRMGESSNRVGESSGAARSLTSSLMESLQNRPTGSNEPSQSSSNADDTIFGVSLRGGLSSTRTLSMPTGPLRNLATARPTIRRPQNTLAVFEPNIAVEVAQQAEREDSMEVESGIWSEVLKLMSRLEGARGPRRFSTSLTDIITRLEAICENEDGISTALTESTRLRLLMKLYPCVVRANNRSQRSTHSLTTRLNDVIYKLRNMVLPCGVASANESGNVESSADTEADSSSDEESSSEDDDDNQPPILTDSSTNTEPVHTRSMGVSTSGSQSETAANGSQPNVIIGRVRHEGIAPQQRQQQQQLRFFYADDPVPWTARPDSIQCTLNSPQRVQRWRLDEQVNNLDNRDNVIIHRCRIHNDAAVDISQDGSILAVFVKNPNTAHCPGVSQADTMLRLVSLREENLGDVLHQEALVAKPVSVSISPLNGYVAVGFAGWQNLPGATDHPLLKFDIYKVPEERGVRLKMVRSVLTSRESAPRAIVNCLKWLPLPGQGLVVGTNHGNVVVYHSTSSDKANLCMNSTHLLDLL